MTFSIDDCSGTATFLRVCLRELNTSGYRSSRACAASWSACF